MRQLNFQKCPLAALRLDLTTEYSLCENHYSTLSIHSEPESREEKMNGLSPNSSSRVSYMRGVRSRGKFPSSYSSDPHQGLDKGKER